jgi:hypothetical protein
MLAATNDAVALHGLRLSALVVTGLVALGLPVLVGLLTKMRAHPLVKGSLAIIFDALNALIVAATLNDGTAWLSKQTFFQFLISLGISEATYLKIWKPAGTNTLAPEFGIGGNAGTGARVNPASRG